jgi:hypothetical protein
LATFVEGLKTVESESVPKRREKVIRGTFDFPEVPRGATFRYLFAGAFALIVFLVTLVGLAKYFHS